MAGAAGGGSNSRPFCYVSDKALTACLTQRGKFGRWRDVVSILEETSNQSLRPNCISSNAALSAFSRSSRWSWTLCYFHHLDETAEIDMVTCGTVIHALGIGGLTQPALNLYASMSSRRLEAGITTLNEMVTACERGSRWRQALHLGTSASTRGLQADVVTRGSLACSYERGSLWLHALQLLRWPPWPRWPQSLVLCGAIITCCSSSLQWQWAQETLPTSASPSEKRSFQICSRAALTGMARSGHWELTCARLQEIWKLSAGSDVRAYNIALKACEVSGKWREALLLLKLMKKRRIRIDEVSLATAADACNRQGVAWTLALNLLEEVLTSALRPDVELLTTTLVSFEAGGKWRAAVQHLKVFQSFAQRVDETAQLALTGAYQKASAWQDALLIPAVDLSLQNALLGTCSQSSCWRQALYLLGLMAAPDVLSYALAFGDGCFASEVLVKTEHLAVTQLKMDKRSGLEI
eukprot:s137_g12.t1